MQFIRTTMPIGKHFGKVIFFIEGFGVRIKEVTELLRYSFFNFIQSPKVCLRRLINLGGFGQGLLTSDPKPNRRPSTHLFDFKLFHIF